MKKLVDPVMAAYAKEIGAEKIYDQINASICLRRSRERRRGRQRPRRRSREHAPSRHAQIHRRLPPAPDLAPRRDRRDPRVPGDAADHLALHAPLSALHLDRGAVALPVHLDGDDRGDDRHPREDAFRGRRLAASSGRRRNARSASSRICSSSSSPSCSCTGACASCASAGTRPPSLPICRWCRSSPPGRSPGRPGSCSSARCSSIISRPDRAGARSRRRAGRGNPARAERRMTTKPPFLPAWRRSSCSARSSS